MCGERGWWELGVALRVPGGLMKGVEEIRDGMQRALMKRSNRRKEKQRETGRSGKQTCARSAVHAWAMERIENMVGQIEILDRK